MQMQRIAQVNHPNANANASVNAMLPTLVSRQKLDRCRPSWKNTSTALPYLSFFAFALNVWTPSHFHLRLRLHLHRMSSWNDIIISDKSNIRFAFWTLLLTKKYLTESLRVYKHAKKWGETLDNASCFSRHLNNHCWWWSKTILYRSSFRISPAYFSWLMLRIKWKPKTEIEIHVARLRSWSYLNDKFHQ